MKGKYEHILCVITGTHQTDAIANALTIAQHHQAKFSLLLTLEALPPSAQVVVAAFNTLESELPVLSQAKQWLADTKAKIVGDYPCETRITMGHPEQSVIDYVEANHVDLVIKLREESLLDRILVSEDTYLLRHCPCPIWLQPSKGIDVIKTIVAAVDLNYHLENQELDAHKQLNLDVITNALGIAAVEGAQLHIVYAYEPVPDFILRDGFIETTENHIEEADLALKREAQAHMEALLDELKHAVDEKTYAYLAPKAYVIKAHPERGIIEFTAAKNADCLVLGSKGRTGAKGFFIGNKVEDIVHRIDCSMVSVHKH